MRATVGSYKFAPTCRSTPSQTMLTGRESLLRVIGKPRRFLPNRLSILSATATSTSQAPILYQKDENVKRDLVEIRSGDGSDAEESVNCPVCGILLPGRDNTLINSHLDDCLARGSKRKLSQVTLLQFNFSRSKVKIHSGQSVDKENQNFPSEPKKISTCDSIHNLNGLDSSEEHDNKHHYMPLETNPFANCVEILDAKDLADVKCASTSLLLDIERPKYVQEECLDDCDTFKVSIPTFIVGRRYGTREELNVESRIYLSRDPENVKDPNAIKVSYVDCENGNMLGYIPRELAQYLSPLIDKFHLNFEVMELHGWDTYAAFGISFSYTEESFISVVICWHLARHKNMVLSSRRDMDAHLALSA